MYLRRIMTKTERRRVKGVTSCSRLSFSNPLQIALSSLRLSSASTTCKGGSGWFQGVVSGVFQGGSLVYLVRVWPGEVGWELE